ncbi:MAG: hypothetical protein AAF732_13465 [Pseudomonadota bacterium]
MQTDADVSSRKALLDKFAIVGVGETTYTRGSGMTTRALATWALRNAMADAGLKPGDVDGLLSYSMGDSTPSTSVATDLGIRPNFFMDVWGGGSSTEALVGIAIGVIEAGMCNTVAVFRAMNGYSRTRIGGTGAGAQAPISGDELHYRPFGWHSPAEWFAPTFMRYMYEHGITPEQAAAVKVAHARHAANNPKALMKERVTIDDVLSSRVIVRPLHLLDCCLETDNGAAIIVTRAERARDCRAHPVLIKSVAGRVCKPRPDMSLQTGPSSIVAGRYARDFLWSNAGVGPEDMDVTGAYDAFTFTAMLQFEAYGFCEPGGAGAYVSDGGIEIGGPRPNNTSGGHLCEGYTHGISMVIENVRQLRHDVDDSCPIGSDGRRQHTFDYAEAGCRQVRDAQLSANLGWGTPGYGSALVLGRA